MDVAEAEEVIGKWLLPEQGVDGRSLVSLLAREFAPADDLQRIGPPA